MAWQERNPVTPVRQIRGFTIVPAGTRVCVQPAGRDDLSSETMRLSLQKERGRAVVTPLTNSAATSLQITFKRQFDTIPHVSLTPDSSAVGDVFLGCGVTAVTTSGFLLWIRRSNTTNTGIYWQADAS